MRLRLLVALLGAILRPASALFLLPLGLDLLDGDGTGALSFAVGGAACMAAGLLCGRLPRPIPRFGRAEAFALVALSWMVLSAVSAIPLVVQGCSFVDGLFETMSGYTTTGASIVTDYGAYGRGFFLWRALTNWVGGAGVISIFILILPGLGGGGRQLFLAQSSVAPSEVLSPQVRRMARTLLGLYAVLTLVETLLLVGAGMSLYDAALHSMASLATGGFSPNGASLAGYANPAADWIIVVFMFLGGASFPLLATGLRRGPGAIVRDGEFLLYLGVTLGLSAAVAVALAHGIPGGREVREAAFNTVSLVSTTGFANADFDRWNDGARALLMVAAVLGGCAASTAGGAKMIRLLIVCKVVRREVVQTLHPSAVVAIRTKQATVPSPILRAVIVVVILYAVGYLLVGTILVVLGADLVTGYTAAIGCLNNVGPGLGQVGPMASYAGFPDASKLVLVVAMWLGRLEILPVVALLHAGAWRGTRWRTPAADSAVS